MMPRFLSARPTSVSWDLSTLPLAWGGVEVMAAPVGVERAEKPVFCDRLVNAAQGTVRALLLAEERRGDLARGIVQRHD